MVGLANNDNNSSLTTRQIPIKGYIFDNGERATFVMDFFDKTHIKYSHSMKRC